MQDALLSRFQDRSARIGIIGQGYVGLPLALLFHEAGFAVTGLDVAPRKVEALRKRESFINHIGAERVAAAVKGGRYQATTDFDGLELAGEINTSMPRWVVGKISDPLNDDAKPLEGSKVLVLGLAYKANIDDDRESPSYEIIELLQHAGAQVDYCDPCARNHTPVALLD